MQLKSIEEGSRFIKIYYSKQKNNYFLKDLGEGPGVFVRIDKGIKLEEGTVVSFGRHHLVINCVVGTNEDHDNKIEVQAIEGQNVISQQ